MGLSTVIISEDSHGIHVESGDVRIFWGKRDSSLQVLERQFPDLRFARVHQVHGDRLVTAPAAAGTQADAHSTREPNLALLIATADCLPVMLHDPKTGWIAAIHAGWRGVANRIVPKALGTATEDGVRAVDLRAWIGPHIGLKSFEVETDVRDLLLASAPGDLVEALTSPSGDANRVLVDLDGLMRAQLQGSGVLPQNIFAQSPDTKTDLRFHSHRRDREQAGRNLSFIVRCP